MAALRFADIRFRPTEFLDFTSLTLDEFQILVAPFEAAFQVHMIGSVRARAKITGTSNMMTGAAPVWS